VTVIEGDFDGDGTSDVIVNTKSMVRSSFQDTGYVLFGERLSLPLSLERSSREGYPINLSTTEHVLRQKRKYGSSAAEWLFFYASPTRDRSAR
jgi:hypothetical protein